MKTLLSVATLSAFALVTRADEPRKLLHPKFPIVDGTYQMTDNWAVTLDQPHNRRIEDGSLVIWRPGFTIWAISWNLKEGESPERRFKVLKDDVPASATDLRANSTETPYRLSYRLDEHSTDRRQPAFYGFTVGPSGHVQIAIYFDDPKDLKSAEKIFKSVTPTKPKANQRVGH